MRSSSPSPSFVALRIALVLVGVSGCQCDCTPEPLVTTECNFVVTPSGQGTEIQFNATQVGASAEKSWKVENTGKGVSLSALKTTFESVNGDQYTADIPEGTNISVGDDQTFVVTFHPTVQAVLASSFVVSHPDVGQAKCPTQTVFLRGEGTEEPEVDAGFPDAGPEDAGVFDAGPVEDAGTINDPDGGVILPPNGEWFAYGGFEDARARFAAVQLQDGSGDILVVGGYGEDGVALDSIERLNPTTGVSRIVAHMAVARAEPAAVVQSDGKVMILGGRSNAINGFALRTIEILTPNPQTGDTLACLDPGGCGLNNQDAAVLPVGRIGAFATSTATGVMLVLGRTLDVDGNEVPIGGGDLVTLAPTLARAAITNEGLLSPRVGFATVVDSIGNDGSFLVIGGTSDLGDPLDDIVLVAGGTHSAGLVGNLFASPDAVIGARTEAAAALLQSGDVLVAGGFNGGGVGLTGVTRITDAFGGGSTIADVVDLDITPRSGGSLVALSDDILLWAGGMAARTDDLDATDSKLPQTSADVLVPFGASGQTFLRLSPDNDLAAGRFEHQVMPYSSVSLGAPGGVLDTAVFMGGVDTSPRRTPHPHVERYVLDQNRFLTFGLMGDGTALEAGVTSTSQAALLSAGGVDPHTGRVSSAVRAFDADLGTFQEDGELREPRRDHTATRISVTEDNSLLIAGGRDENGVVLSSLSFFDSGNKVDRPLPVSLATPRANHTATRLQDGNPVKDGAVVLCGGQGQGGEALDTCEVFVPPENPLDPATYDDPVDGAKVLPVLGRMQFGRVGHTATLLDNGEVLFVGGGNVNVDIKKADLFVPDDTQSFVRSTSQPTLARTGHAAVFLGGGRVLVVGGEVSTGGLIGATRSAELYVRGTETWLALPEMEQERAQPAAFLLADGNVIVAGGSRSNSIDPDVPTRSNRTSELYTLDDSGTGTGDFQEFGNGDLQLSHGRSDIVFIDVLGRAIIGVGAHRDGIVTTGDERRTPITFIDFLQDPADAFPP